MTDGPVFYYDFSSPYSYLAASRIDELLPQATWRPIVFGALLRETGKVPWSLRRGREAEMEAIERRAQARGLPPLRWPQGWPRESYSLLPLQAALAAEDQGLLQEASLALYEAIFAQGRRLDVLDNVLEAVGRAGLEPEAVRVAMEDEGLRGRLRAATREAIERGVTGVPTVAVDGSLFWGDDRLEAAAAATRG